MDSVPKIQNNVQISIYLFGYIYIDIYIYFLVGKPTISVEKDFALKLDTLFSFWWEHQNREAHFFTQKYQQNGTVPQESVKMMDCFLAFQSHKVPSSL